MTISPVIAQVSTPNPVTQAQKSPRDLATEAKKQYQNGNFQEARKLWEQTATAFADSGERLNEAMALSNLSITYQQLGKWEKANTEIQESLKLLKTAPANSLVLAQTLDIQGNLQRETGKPVEALDTWKEAANIYEELGKSIALEQNKLNQVQIMQDLGLYPRACKTLLELLGTPFKDLTCPPLERKISLEEKIKNQKNKFSDKEQEIEKTLTPDELEEKLQRIQENSISFVTVEELRILGDVLRVLGQQKLSKIVLHNSLNLAKKLDSHQNIDKINTEIGAIYLNMGKTAHSLTKEEIEPIRGKRRDNEKQAIEFYEQAIQISPDFITRQQAELNQLSLLIQAKQWSKAKSLYETIAPQFKLLTQSNKFPFRQSEIFVQIKYVNIFIKLLDPDQPQPPDEFSIPGIKELDGILANATQKAQKLGDIRAEAYALGNLGRLHELNSILNNSKSELLTAKEYTTKALALVSSFNSPDITYQYFWQLGRIHKQQGNLEKAISAYTKAYNDLESIRKDIININSSVQFSFRDNIEPIYRQLVALDLLYVETLEKAKNIFKEEEIQEDIKKRLIQARNVIESLQIAQLNNFFLEPCVEGNPQQIDAIDSDTAVIYTIILPDKLGVLLSLPDQPPLLYSTDISQEKVNDVIKSIKSSLLTNDKRVKLELSSYQELYNWLISPLEVELVKNEIKNIAFVLDGNLRNIPMSILHDGKKYLVERYALALTPGMQLLEPQPLNKIKLHVISAGLSEEQDNFAALPGVEKELQAIQNMGLADGYLLDDNFSAKALKQTIINSGDPIIHLATHAKFSSKVEDTFILTGKGKINIRDLDDLLRDETFNRENDIELLVLSACQTAAGDSRATLGLAGVAVQSGARSTLATLWSVPDKSTAMMMEEFYNELIKADKNTKSVIAQVNKAEALRQAQLTLMQDPDFSHPHYWAPFILIGNWQ